MNKLHIPAIILCAATAFSAIAETPEEIAAKYPGFTLAFQDEFNTGTVPDPEVWSFEIGMKRNNEDQCYMQENATISDGNLVIEARKERVKNPGYKKYSTKWNEKNQYCDYTSASLIAKPKFHYGIYEMRAKIPVGTGYWPAYWACGNSREWPNNGEIDMLEYYGDAIHANVAWGSTTRWSATWSSKAPRMSTFDADFADHYHVWRMEFMYDAIRLYIDGRLLNETSLDRTVNPTVDWIPGDEGYNPYRDESNLFDAAWVNLALGGNNGGSLDNTPFPAQYLIDYVRVYVPDGIYSALQLKITKAQELLDGTVAGDEPGQYNDETRKKLAEAIAAAEGLVGSATEEEVTAGIETLGEAMDAYKTNVNNVVAGITYRFRHHATGLYLSTGWKDDKHCVLLLGDNRLDGADSKGYCQEITVVDVPETSTNKGFNLQVGDSYIYRDSWNLYVSSSPSLKTKNYIFNVEFADGFAIIKNLGTGKYMGNDDNWAWASVYSDKDGAGNPKAYFEVENVDAAGIASIGVDTFNGEDAVYNLQGIKVAGSVDELAGRGHSQLYIVVSGGKSSKVFVK